MRHEEVGLMAMNMHRDELVGERERDREEASRRVRSSRREDRQPVACTHQLLRTQPRTDTNAP